MNDRILVEKCEKNVKVYKKYKMFAYDFLFYYAISVMYYSITKGFSMSEIMYITGFYTFFMFFWQLPGTFISERLGLKNTLVFGNLLIIFSVLGYLFAPNFKFVVLGDFFGTLGFTLKSLTEGSILYSSLKKLNNRGNFSKIEGKATSKYYYYDAISALLSGFLFLINNYLPIILCLINRFIALYFSFKFENIENNYDKKESVIKILGSFKEIIKSKRARSIFLFACIFMGIISVNTTLYKAILMELGLETQYITMVVSVYTILVGLGAKMQFSIEKITKNKTLSTFGIIFIISMIILGIEGVNGKLDYKTFSVVMICLAFMGVIQGAYRVSIKKYVLNFTTSKIRTKITSIYYMFENIGSSIMMFLSGFLLNFTSNSKTCIIYGSIAFLIMILVIVYMKKRLGLKPEEYSKQELNGVEYKL